MKDDNDRRILAEYTLIVLGERVLEDKTYTSYGIVGKTPNKEITIQYISSNKEFVAKICKALNDYEVSIWHFKDIVEDYITDASIAC